MTASEIRDLVGQKDWDDLFSFTIVRNPWARVLSLFGYMRKAGDIPADWSFADFVRNMVEATEKTPYFGFHGFRYGAVDYIQDRDGRMLVKKIIRFENRDAELVALGARLGIPDFGQVHLQRTAAADVNYRDAYDEISRDLVARRYAQDVDMFEYQF